MTNTNKTGGITTDEYLSSKLMVELFESEYMQRRPKNITIPFYILDRIVKKD